ncbi:MAG TPA: hypothetical protein VKR61_07120 [Bryobacteraceae bacterium]|nr:hypothetical protein [Bryobacteraceae bacterium]
MRAALLLLLMASMGLRAAGPVYVVLWFDTEDYLEPSADDAALRIARDLTSLGVRATFKVVGEKARVLEQRGRRDVLQALALQDIGYHSNFHSVQPTPALYLRDLGFLEGAAEFERREGPGARDLARIFGVRPSCYGQPGSSWAPQTMAALRSMGIPMYLDEGSHVGVGEQPFWYGGLLHVYNMGRFQLRAPLDGGEPLSKACERFDHAAAELAVRGGGVISIYYHPTEFVTTEFWDAVNFARGANPERAGWVRPHRRSEAESERCYGILHGYVTHARDIPGVRFVTARELQQLYGNPSPPQLSRAKIAAHMSARQTFLETDEGVLSAADMLLALLGMQPGMVDGPATRLASTFLGDGVPRAAFEHAKADAVSFIAANKRLPAEVWIGSAALSIGDFAATLAADNGAAESVPVRRANLEFEKYFSNEPQKAFDWLIHPADFRAPELLELARLQGWTLKPARLR